MKKINTNKKIYSKPELEVVSVDHEISLVMASGMDGDLDPGPTSVSTMSAPVPQKGVFLQENDVFGGSNVNY